MLRHTSNNIILYKGRYIRRFVMRGYPPCYIVAWSSGSESRVFYGSLAELMEKIDDTVRFFGKWVYLI